MSNTLNPPYLYTLGSRSAFEDAVRGGIAAPHDILLLYDFARRQDERINAQAKKIEKLEREKKRRVYYQDIVYYICNTLDHIDREGERRWIRCGTIEDPSQEVQNRLDQLATSFIASQVAEEQTP